MGQRFVQLDSSYTAYADNNTAVVHVSQLPPNPAILAPGPALVFVTVNGIPSVGKMVMVGSGQIGEQPILPVEALAPTEIVPKTAGSGGSSGGGDNAAVGGVSVSGSLVALLSFLVSVFVFGS